jgi:tripartite-type tricarboxylate transporter receptor subunit TctC
MAKSTIGITLAIMLAVDGSAESQEWPTRSVTMVVPFAAGGPTSNEQGLSILDTHGWTALFLPKRTPAAIIQRLAKAASDALETTALRQRYLEVGLRVPAPQERSPDYLARLLPVEMARWAGPIKATGVLMD